jgi:hypothetical protein
MSKRNRHVPALLDDPNRVAFEQARAQHQRPLPDLIPYYEQTCKQIARCVRLDELSNIVKESDKWRAIARILENQEAEINLAEIKLRALRRLGELSSKLKKASGPGRGKRLPRRGKSFRLKREGFSTSTAQRGEQLYKMRDEFDRYLAECRERGQPASLEHILRRQQLRPGIQTRPWTNNDEGFFGQDAKGLSRTGRLYKTAERLPDLDKLKLIIRLGASLPESPWHRLLAWLFTDHQASNLAQDLSQRPLADHEPFLSRLAQKQEALWAVDFVEVTRVEANKQKPRPIKQAARRNRHAEA